MSPTGITTTINYPLGIDPNGIVIYTNGSNLPLVNKDYVLKDSTGTTVSDVFHKVTPSFIDINSLLTDSNFTANLSNIGNQAQNSYQTSPGESVTGHQGSIPNPTLTSVSMTAIDDVNGYIYAVCNLKYSGIILNIHYEDLDTGYQSDYTNTTDYTATSLLKIDKYYSKTSFLHDFPTDATYSHMVLDTSILIMYLLKDNVSQKTIIDKMSLTNYAITNLYTTPDNYVNSYGSQNNQVTPFDLAIDSAGNLYVSQNGDGTILKVDSTGSAVVYALFEYSHTKYGYDDPSTQRKFKGRPEGLAFDKDDNLYVSDNGTMFQGGNRTNTYFSTPFIYKIPAGNSNGQIYDTDDALTGQNVYSIGGQRNDLYASFHMAVDNFGNLYIIPDTNTNLYVLNTTTLASSPIDSNVGSNIIRDRDGNIYYVSSTDNNVTRIANTYVFTHVYITDYHSQITATLSLDNTTDNTVIDPNVVVYYVLSSDTSLATFTVDSQNVFDGSTVYEGANVGLVTVVAIPTDSNASAVIYGGSGLITGDNNVSVTVTAQDGVTTQTYNVTVNVADGGTGGGGTGGSGSSPSNDASITSFTVNGTDIYSSGTTTDNVNYDFGTVTLAYITYADVEVYLSESHATTTGAGGRSVSVGDNNVSITVTAEDGVTTNTYALIIHVNPQTNGSNVVCFKEDTKILCLINDEELYIPIQNIRKGTLVKTVLHGYLAVVMIGTSKIYNPSNRLRNSNRLYRCSPNKYPELTEDLIVTGCHSILVSDITKEQRELIIERTGKIYVTDNKYRLNACLDERAEPYEEEGIHNIWHFALENNDYYMNYGIYANGLLVETCSKRMMKEYSGMELLD